MSQFHRYVGKSTVAIEVEVEWEALVPVGLDGVSSERYFEAAARNAADAAEAPFDVDKAKVTKREASRKETMITKPVEPGIEAGTPRQAPRRRPDRIDAELDSGIRGMREQG